MFPIKAIFTTLWQLMEFAVVLCDDPAATTEPDTRARQNVQTFSNRCAAQCFTQLRYYILYISYLCVVYVSVCNRKILLCLDTSQTPPSRCLLSEKNITQYQFF